MVKRYDAEEVVAVRGRCVYQLHTKEPERGQRYWAVRTLAIEFPDDGYERLTGDGVSVELACVICAERRSNGKWQWCHLTALAKRVFGDLLFDTAEDRGAWHFIVEYDHTGDVDGDEEVGTRGGDDDKA